MNFNIFFRLFSFYIGLWASTVYYFGLAFIQFLFTRDEDCITWASHGWGTFNLKNAGVTLDVHGQENLNTYPAIFVLNHQSLLDMFIVCSLSPGRIRPIAKRSFLYIPVLGAFMKLVGVVLLERYDPQKAMVGMREAKKLLDNKFSLVIAPEGTRSKSGELQPLKKGAFHLALQTKIPMVPITIVNAFNLLPKKNWLPKSGIVHVFVETPVSTKDWSPDHLSEHVETVRTIFLSHLNSRS